MKVRRAIERSTETVEAAEAEWVSIRDIVFEEVRRKVTWLLERDLYEVSRYETIVRHRPKLGRDRIILRRRDELGRHEIVFRNNGEIDGPLRWLVTLTRVGMSQYLLALMKRFDALVAHTRDQRDARFKQFKRELKELKLREQRRQTRKCLLQLPRLKPEVDIPRGKISAAYPIFAPAPAVEFE